MLGIFCVVGLTIIIATVVSSTEVLLFLLGSQPVLVPET